MTDPKMLRKLLDYNPETGELTWKERTADMFAQDGQMKSWNTRWAGKPAFTADNGNGYLCGSISGISYRAHRVAWAMCHGKWPDEIDHINGIRRDNRIFNLRSVTRTENNRNAARRKDNASGCVGVSWEQSRGKWLAHIKVNKKNINLGRFSEKSEAIAARQAAEVKYGFHENHGRAAVDDGSGH
tara:strand:- start:202 stop:756 length:555 start_codon:yes stop_codon:yes gene_type:complete